MADQKRWFKVWTSLMVDMDNLPNDVVGAWTRLGCRAAMVGTRGTVTFDGWDHVARFLNTTVDDALRIAGILTPSVVFMCNGGSPPHGANEEGKPVYGTLTVTFRNWSKYQEDSTVAERVKRLRSKRRRDSPPPKDKDKDSDTTREVTSSAPPPGPPEDSEGLSPLWHGGPDRNGQNPDRTSEELAARSRAAAIRALVRKTAARAGVR